MNAAPLALTLVVIGLVVALVAAERTDHAYRFVIKPLASIAFLLIAATTGVVGRYGAFVFAGLVLSAIGDVALLSSKRRAFIAGLGAFLLAHLAYTVAFLSLRPSLPATISAAIVFVVIGALLGRWIIPSVPGDLRVPVLAYMGAITLMVVTAAALGADGLWSVALGGVLFYVSDVAVARNRFVAPAWSNKVWGLPTYYVGQTLLALSVAQTRL